MKQHEHRHQTGFSLIEVTLALGIVSFAILTTLGLLTAGLDMNRDSVANTEAASVARDIAADLQMMDDWHTLTDGDPATNPSPSPRFMITPTDAAAGTKRVFYFNPDGTVITSSSPTLAERIAAEFRVDVKLEAVTDSEPPVFHIVVSWPTGVAGDGPWPAVESSKYEVIASLTPF